MSTKNWVSELLVGNSKERVRVARNFIKVSDRDGFAQLIHLLEGVGESKQAKAIKSLAQVGTDAVPILAEILRCSNPSLSKFASAGLIQIGAPAVEAVIACLEESEWYKRRAAAETLGDLSDARAVQPLIHILEQRPYSPNIGDWLSDGDAYVCSAAIEALAKLADNRASEQIAQMSSDPSDLVRKAAAQAISSLKHKSQGQKQLSVDACIKLLDDPSQEVRVSAVRTLIKLKTPLAIIALIKAMKDSFLCGEIMDFLEKIQFGAESVDTLISATEEGNHASENYILDRLKKIGPAATAPLIKTLQTPNNSQRLIAARALAHLKDERAVEPLLDLVQRQTVDNMAIGWALAELGAPAISHLITRLVPQDDSVSSVANMALTRMGSSAIPLLIQTMDNRNIEAYVRYECASAITYICQKNKEALKGKWSTCVCGEHLESFRKWSLPVHTNLRRISELRNRNYYIQQSSTLSMVANAGLLESGFTELFRTVSNLDYYACPICSQDRIYFSPVQRIALVLDDNAKNLSPVIKNQILYFPWSPLSSAFRFNWVEIRSIAYPYSTTIERFVHRMELQQRKHQTPAAPHPFKIPYTISSSCKLSAADQNRLQVYCYRY